MSKVLQAILPIAAMAICYVLMILTGARRFREKTLTARAFAVIFTIGLNLQILAGLFVSFAVSPGRLQPDLFVFVAPFFLLKLIATYSISYFGYKYFGRRLIEYFYSVSQKMRKGNTSENMKGTGYTKSRKPRPLGGDRDFEGLLFNPRRYHPLPARQPGCLPVRWAGHRRRPGLLTRTFCPP